MKKLIHVVMVLSLHGSLVLAFDETVKFDSVLQVFVCEKDKNPDECENTPWPPQVFNPEIALAKVVDTSDQVSFYGYYPISVERQGKTLDGKIEVLKNHYPTSPQPNTFYDIRLTVSDKAEKKSRTAVYSVTSIDKYMGRFDLQGDPWNKSGTNFFPVFTVAPPGWPN